MMQKLVQGLTKKQAKQAVDLFFDIFDGKPLLLPTAIDAAVKNKKVVKLSVKDMELAEVLSIKLNQFIDSTGYNYKKPAVDELGVAISQLHRLNGKPYEEIHKVVRYLYEYYAPNSSFDWRMQVRSGIAFRKHYEKIVATMNQDYNFIKSRQIEDVR